MPRPSRPFWFPLALCALVSAFCIAQETAPPQPKPEPALVIHAGMVLAVPGEAPSGPQTIVVRDGRIVAVEPGLKPATDFGVDSRLIDLSRAFVLPGLIDLHQHLAIDANADPLAPVSESRLALAAAGYARRLLEAGVTSVRDTGDNSGVTLALRDAIANGTLPGPRIFASGRVISRTGGHGAKRAGAGQLPYPPAGCDGAESCRRAVRENIEAGADWIKLTVSGSGREVGGRADAPPIMFDDEIEAAIAAARQAGRPVAAHAHSRAAINAALAAGATTIEHGTYFDDTSVRLFKQRGATLVPTAFVADHVRAQLERYAGGPDGRSQDELKQWAQAAMAVPGRAWRAGIPLAVGSDGGPSFAPDATVHELELYVAAGVPAADAIEAATKNGAAVLGMSAELGAIRPGYLADFIAVEDNPLQDVGRLRHPVFVIKDGTVIVSPPGVSPSAAGD